MVMERKDSILKKQKSNFDMSEAPFLAMKPGISLKSKKSVVFSGTM